MASAMPSVLRVMVADSSEMGSARLKANTTRPMPISMVVGMLISVSTSHLMFSLRIRRCSIQGRTSTFSNSVSPAE